MEQERGDAPKQRMRQSEQSYQNPDAQRAFGKRRMFADSPTARWLGFGLRVGDPALPLLRSEARLNEQAKFLLRG
jgi:hypothetical protein